MYWCTGRCLRRWFHGVSGNTEHAARAAAALFRMPEESIAVTYNGVDFELLRASASRAEMLASLGESEDGVSRIGTSSNFRDCKRIDLLLRAVAELSDLRIRCYLIGDGPARAGLERLSQKLNLGARVRFVGRQERVANYLQLLDIFVLPSNTAESFGNSAVEAMGLGIPTIVMADGGGMVEHFPEGLRNFPGNQQELTARIRELVDSPRLRWKFARESRDYVRHKYTLQQMVQAYEQFYAAARQRSMVRH